MTLVVRQDLLIYQIKLTMFSPSKTISKDDIQELYYITDIDNVASILDKGILSHNNAQNIPHKDISSKKIQALRQGKVISSGVPNEPKSPLWSFVCLFAQPHNAMMYVSREKHICVLRIDKNILSEENVLISDRNASCRYAKFTQAKNWTLTDKTAQCLYSRYSLPCSTTAIDTNDYKSIRQLEILCPKTIAKHYILGFFTKQKEDMQELLNILKEKLISLPISINANIFFLGKSLKLKTFTPIVTNTLDDSTQEQVNTSENANADEAPIIDAFGTFTI